MHCSVRNWRCSSAPAGSPCGKAAGSPGASPLFLPSHSAGAGAEALAGTPAEAGGSAAGFWPPCSVARKPSVLSADSSGLPGTKEKTGPQRQAVPGWSVPRGGGPRGGGSQLPSSRDRHALAHRPREEVGPGSVLAQGCGVARAWAGAHGSSPQSGCGRRRRRTQQPGEAAPAPHAAPQPQTPAPSSGGRRQHLGSQACPGAGRRLRGGAPGGRAAEAVWPAGRGGRKAVGGPGKDSASSQAWHRPPGGRQSSRLVPTLCPVHCGLPPATPLGELPKLDAPARLCRDFSGPGLDTGCRDFSGPGLDTGCPGYHQPPLPMHPPGEAAWADHLGKLPPTESQLLACNMGIIRVRVPGWLS